MSIEKAKKKRKPILDVIVVFISIHVEIYIRIVYLFDSIKTCVVLFRFWILFLHMASPSLCQQYQCDAFQFTICRHCQLFLCIKHLAEHQQQFPSDFQRLLDDARKQQAQLSTTDVKYSYTVKYPQDNYSNRYQPTNIFDDDGLFENITEG